jgi:hypothetical protein
VRRLRLEDALDDAQAGDLLLVRDGTLLIRDDGGIACVETVQLRGSLPPQCDGIGVHDVGPVAGQSWAILTGTYLARYVGNDLAGIRYVEGWNTRTDNGSGWSGVEVSGVMQMVGGRPGAPPAAAPGAVTASDRSGQIIATAETE